MFKLLGAIDEGQVMAARQRVTTLRAQYPTTSNEALVDMLIRRRCIDTGLIGFATSAPALLPGAGSVIAMTAGLVTDIRKTMEMQKEMALEIAAIYERELTPADRRNLLILISGVDTGNKLMTKAGADLAVKAAGRLSSRYALRALPIAALGASAGVNVVSTYLIGRRAQAYMQLDPDAVNNWQESLRTLSGVDERQIIGILSEILVGASALLGAGAHKVQDALMGAGRSVVTLARRTPRLLPGPRRRPDIEPPQLNEDAPDQ
jgi:hypothetical protein